MDFRFIGRYSITNVDFTVINAANALVNADAPPVAEFRNYATNALIWSRSTTLLLAPGKYRLTLSSAETSTYGLYYIRWLYAIAGVAQEYRTDVEVPANTSTLYDVISDDYRAVVDGVWGMFEDLFDSATGGPHLQMYAQSKFGRERLAQLMAVGLGKLNSFAQPHQSFSLDGTAEFPFSQWGPLLSVMTHIEMIKHLMRSYVEQPDAQNISGSVRLDRRDYLTRWQTMLEIEQEDAKLAIDTFKMSMMNLGRGSLLVSGGIYGSLVPFNPAIRPRNLPGFVR